MDAKNLRQKRSAPSHVEQRFHGFTYMSRHDDTLIMVKRVVDDIDGIVHAVCFDGWQATHAGECEVKKSLRQTLFRYKLHQDADVFEKAYGYIREYY